MHKNVSVATEPNLQFLTINRQTTTDKRTEILVSTQEIRVKIFSLTNFHVFYVTWVIVTSDVQILGHES